MFTLGAAACLATQTANALENKVSFEIGPVPGWVKPVEAAGDVEIGSERAGIVYLLADRQDNVERRASYYHEVRKVTSENGAKNSTSISISFDPSIEKLIFHSVTLTRKGTASNRLDRSRIKLARRQTDPEQSVYDPVWTVQVALDDIRVGDIVEFAFSREGGSPLRRGKYAATYLLQWEALIWHNVFRVVWPENRALAVRTENGARSPKVTTTNGLTELWYESHNVPARTIEDNAPEDYDPRERLDISEFRDWGDVAQWAMALFQTELPRSSEFNAEITKLRTIIDPEQRVAAALQFVQDEIRYVKIATWLGGHPLTPPDGVLQRGFANNMDKGLLLVTLLRASGIDAAPALVSGSFRSSVRDLLPSSDVIDHVIAQVRVGGRTYWLNPAAVGQRGPLSQIYVPRYGYALVLRPGISELTAFETPPGSFPVKRVIENYRVPPPDKIPDLEVISEYRGLAADRTRALFRENTREEIQKRYLEYYDRIFPDAKAQKSLWYEELPGENACRVTESYIIPRLWQLNDDKNRYALYLQPLEIYSAIGSTISPQREDPLRLEYPNTVIEEINVQMFDDWPFNADAERTHNEFFRVRNEPSANGAALQFHYSYETLKDRVEVAEIEKFNEAASKAKDGLGYTLRYQTPEQMKKAKSLAAFNWAVGAGAFCFFVMTGFLAYGYFRRSRLAQPLPPPFDAPARLNGIGGWLILLAVVQVLLPLRFVKPIFDVFSATMNTASWRSLTDPIESSYDAWWAPALLFELFFNLGALLFGALLVALFFTRKAAWRRVFAFFLIFFLLGAVIDTILVDRIPSAAEPVFASFLGLAPLAVAAAIWIPYVSLSKRVRATFRY